MESLMNGVIKRSAPFLGQIILSACILLCHAAMTSGQEAVAQADDPELKNLQWNRYANKNFTVVSIDDTKGAALSDAIVDIKSKSITRWGFPDVQISRECRIFCVPSQKMLTKLFNLNSPRMQVRKELYVIWTVLGPDIEKSVMPFVTEVALAELESKQGMVLPTWFERGAVGLAAAPPEIAEGLRAFNSNARREQFSFSAEQMFLFTDDEYAKQNAESKKVFDMQAICLCLMLRKEFGEAKLQGFLRLQNRNKPESVLKVVYGFSGFPGFESKYFEYMKDLTADVVDRRTPESYLTIEPVRE